MPLRFVAHLHCDSLDLGVFPYSFSSNEDEKQLAASSTPIPLVPYSFYVSGSSLQQMLETYNKLLRLGRALPLSQYNPADVVFGTISSQFIKEPCSHFISGVELFCSACKKYHACKYCHEDSECFDFVCTKLRCTSCAHEQALSEFETTCPGCSKQIVDYECRKCLIFTLNSAEYPLFHCHDCNECISGMQDDFVTCKNCKECVRKLFYSLHQCKESGDLCCICHGQFDNVVRKRVTFRCKHYMHYSCWREIGDKCPLCNKELREVVEKTTYNEKYMEYLFRISTGKYSGKMETFRCNECEEVFESVDPPCCCEPFCRSCDCQQYEGNPDVEMISSAESNHIFEVSGCPVAVYYKNPQQIKKLFLDVLMRQSFWQQFDSEPLTLFLDYCNAIDCPETWQAVCLLLNKGYKETSVTTRDGLREEFVLCASQICEFLDCFT